MKELWDDFSERDIKYKQDMKLIRENFEMKCKEVSSLQSSLEKANAEINNLRDSSEYLQNRVDRFDSLLGIENRENVVKSLLDSSINNGWMSDDMEAGIYHKMLDLIVEKIDTKLI